MDERHIERLESDTGQAQRLVDVIRQGATRLAAAGCVFGHGTDNALDEARAMACQMLGLPPDTPDVYLNAQLASRERAAIMNLIAQRATTRQPAAYLLGEAWYVGMPFTVDSRVLIPRSPIGQLLERRLEPWVDASTVRRIVDLGTGSGALAIMAAHAFPGARVDAVDVSPAALEVAAHNVERHGLARRVMLHQGDLFEPLADTYDLILSNPPYLDEAEYATLPPEYLAEPRLGLVAGLDALALAEKIIHESAAFLSEDGLLVMDVGGRQLDLEARFPELPLTWPWFEQGGDGVLLAFAPDLQAGHGR